MDYHIAIIVYQIDDVIKTQNIKEEDKEIRDNKLVEFANCAYENKFQINDIRIWSRKTV